MICVGEAGAQNAVGNPEVFRRRVRVQKVSVRVDGLEIGDEGEHGGVGLEVVQHGFDLAGRPAVILIAEENQIAAAGLEGAQKALAKAVILRGGQNFPVNLGMRQTKIVEDAQRAVGRAVVADDNFIDGAGLGADGGKLLGEKAFAVIGAHGDGAEHNRPPWRM